MVASFQFGAPEVKAVLLATGIIAFVAMVRYWHPHERG